MAIALAVADYSVGGKFSTEEIPRQLQIIRQKSDPGAIHYHLRSVLENPALAAAVRAQYAQPVLVPASPWLAAVAPEKPRLTVSPGRQSASVRWESGGKPVSGWVLQIFSDGNWRTEILLTNQIARSFQNYLPDAVAVRAVDRLGNLSAPALWSAKNLPAPGKVAPRMLKASAAH